MALDLTSFQYTKNLVFPSAEYKLQLKKTIGKQPMDEKALAYGKKYDKELQIGYETPSEIIWASPEVGHGLINLEDLKEGDFVGEYTGLICEHNSYYKLKNYIYSYPYIEGYSKSLSIDAEEFGNHTRFINHSFSPNLTQHYAFHGGLYHLILIANQPIKKRTQLNYSYGHNYWYLRGAPKEL